ncbi:hypothetical protein [Lonepinella koalarum]|uniref:Uncharacterized protein n=1 Tax=Lonepinella koalarum TaxID=53417 RepID=A0A4R1KRL2_9PAST|nr:hypothetical protein [Lonepinella koalarum]MDH2925606.1 hypothetical protein [Lonepinella koalarum]MDH2927289.1 hypothetical protein [Lonepinella koalarum]TCK67200.1 hypothetical protein EV692_2110 [Lonepinella koalarum]TFJ89142.1 hypothetical protein E0709_09745 [Lonepinella koalarum]
MLNTIKQWFKSKNSLITTIQRLDKEIDETNEKAREYSNIAQSVNALLEQSRIMYKEKCVELAQLNAKLHNQQIQHENKITGLQKVIDNQAKDILQLKAKLEKKKQRYFKRRK